MPHRLTDIRDRLHDLIAKHLPPTPKERTWQDTLAEWWLWCGKKWFELGIWFVKRK